MSPLLHQCKALAVFVAALVAATTLTPTHGAMTQEEAMAMLREANANSRDTVRSSIIASGNAPKELRDKWVEEWRLEVGGEEGSNQWQGDQRGPDEVGSCFKDDDCNGHGSCFIGFCSAQEFKDKESCEGAAVCVVRDIEMRRGKVPVEADRQLVPQFTTAAECMKEGQCYSPLLKETLPNPKTEEDCLAKHSNTFGTCIVDSVTVDEFQNDEAGCIASHGGICYAKFEDGLINFKEPLNKFKAKPTCEAAGGMWHYNGSFNVIKNEWNLSYAWIEPIWYAREMCVCELGYAGKNCELIDQHIFLADWKEKHGDAVLTANHKLKTEVNYRFVKYGPKTGKKVQNLRAPVELKYEERLAQDNRIAFSSAANSKNEAGTLVVNLLGATPGWKAVLQEMREGDVVEAVLTKHNHHEDGQGIICRDCYALLNVELVKIRSDLAIPSFEHDVQHLGDEENVESTSTLPCQGFADYLEAESAKSGTIVMFYSPTCGHSRAFMPSYAEGAVKHKDLVPFTAVDCSAHVETCRKNSIDGYPTIKYSKGSKNMKFKDARSAEGIDKFVQRLEKGKMFKSKDKKKVIRKITKKKTNEAEL